METVSFGTFSHLKADVVGEMLDAMGEIIVKIKPKNTKARTLSIVDAGRLEHLKTLEIRYEREQKAERWRAENKEAIEALNDFTVKSGGFASEHRVF
jgi:post-segregation antitoxin (ccd killing protein)